MTIASDRTTSKAGGGAGPNGHDLFDADRLRFAYGLTKSQARSLLRHADHTGHGGRPVLLGADAVELLLPELDDGEDDAP